MYARDELFLRSPECNFSINTKITLSVTLKQFVTRVHALFTMNSRIIVSLKYVIPHHFNGVIVPFHYDFFHSGEQPEQHELSHTL